VRGEGGQHRPLLGQGPLDVLHPGQALQRRRQLVVGQMAPRRAELVQHQLEPQFAGLVLHDEQQLVVVFRAAARVLGREQVVQVEVVVVAHRPPEVGAHRLLDGPDR
jgi:hypothetical protein